jgi:hypothetical protein
VEREQGEKPFRLFALKCVSKSRLSRIRLMRGTGLDMIKNEINIMRNLFHRNIILLFEVGGGRYILIKIRFVSYSF